MNVSEKRGLLKGLGIGIILCTAIFYMLVLDLRVDYNAELNDDDRVIQAASELGMMFQTEGMMPETVTEDMIVEEAKKLGMIFPETKSE